MLKKLFYCCILCSLLFTACKTTKNPVGLKRACPEAWIVNNMPGPNHHIRRQEYLIYKSERHELKEFDMEWIKKNCKIEPQMVQ
jgi:hypothetical protein